MRGCCRVRANEEERNKNKEKGIEKEELNFLVQPRQDKGEILWGTCLTKERKDHDPPFQFLAFILFTLP